MSLMLLLTLLASGADAQERLAPFDLLQFHDVDDRVTKVRTREQWQSRREQVVHGMIKIMGPMPDETRRVPLRVETHEEIDAGTYVRRLISYQSEPGSRTPAYLCVPKSLLHGRRQAPAVLCLHPTDNRNGHKVVVGLAGREGRQYAAELAERGYVTLAPAYPHLAQYWPNLSELGYVSGTMKAIWDNSRALDLLSTLRYVEQFPRVRCHRALARRPQRDLHGRVRSPHLGGGEQLWV